MPYPVNSALASNKDQREGSRRSLSSLMVSLLSNAPVTAVFVFTFSIVVTVFAINRILRYFCGTTETAAVVASAVLPTTSAKILLTKRARWSFPMGGKGAGLIIAAAAYATPYLVAAICYAISSGACAPIAGGIIAAVSVSVAGIVAGSGNGSAATKRGLTVITSVLGHQVLLEQWPHSNKTVLSTTSGGLLKFEFKGTAEVNSVKRDTPEPFNFVTFKSDLGKHIAVSSIHGSEELSQIIVAAVPGEINNSTLLKRDEFSVSWLSYNYDDSNYDLASEWQERENNDYAQGYMEDQLQDFLEGNRDWKYCLALNDLNNGEAADYDDMPGVGDGTGNAVHGEIYFNTYGGVDNYCNDDHDGAQNTGDGRDSGQTA